MMWLRSMTVNKFCNCTKLWTMECQIMTGLHPGLYVRDFKWQWHCANTQNSVQPSPKVLRMTQVVVFTKSAAIQSTSTWISFYLQLWKTLSKDVFLVYRTSWRSGLDILNPSSWLMISLQRDFLPRRLISSKDDAEAGKQKVTFFCKKRRRDSKHQPISRLTLPFTIPLWIFWRLSLLTLVSHILQCAFNFLWPEFLLDMHFLFVFP